MSKTFDRVWHKSMPSKLPPYGFQYFLSSSSVSAVVDGHCSTPKPINSGVLRGSVLSPTLFLLFINDLSSTKSNLHAYVDDSTLHYSTSFISIPTTRWILQSRVDAARCLTSALSITSDWGRRNSCPSMPPKPIFFIYQLGSCRSSSCCYCWYCCISSSSNL